ncbi:ethanolamine ammonia-lyase reactivating factor EutA [Phytohabitans sp. ZYX-F-186]|uniref:Ethanolamine ammonia-lyase reactivating factor EutA n=1 Tax=Phytohabitans maris TaxID=3071409 RepID=A0ABU0ZKK4_9ACTN|nr:ethanolamine ammonia-lyase reactivating factor EutA [Phytohabitans sp. ZYX-F-186]MDQ7907575.1 ethanolamine ammonia-lyase reactivating factor EutA [Phytohabitans sp. ZYX-F-186]
MEVQSFEQHTLTSVGIDIGSSTSHVVLSRLRIRRQGDFSSRFVVTDREVVYLSPPRLTPYSTGTTIDVTELETFVRASYEAAGLQPKDVETGAVVVTGEALNKHNAQQIADLAAHWSGDFICVSAGPRHEALLAAHGSGSVALSRATTGTVLNVDIGGGTTKVSLVENGAVTHLEVFSVGARLVAFDDAGMLTRIEPPAYLFADELGVTLAVGRRITQDVTEAMAGLMARVVLDSVTPGPAAELRARLMVTPSGVPSRQHGCAFDHIVFSGGVSEYIDDRDDASYGDLGPALGRHIRRLVASAGLTDLLAPAEQGIRATVLGASQFSVQASGQTCYIAEPSALPVRNLPVARVELCPGADHERALIDTLSRVDRISMDEPIALVVEFAGPRNYQALRRYAEALVRVAAGHPLYLVLRDDLARSLGRLIAEELGHAATTVVDEIEVGDLEYLDIGKPMGATRSLPVTVKSLAFPHQQLAHAAGRDATSEDRNRDV